MKVIAIYLPQFHPFKENDGWWGPGFTEWTNVTRAKSLFKGHQQPKHPTDFGYYDLRLKENLIQHGKVAEGFGLNGFCFYHYWFNGKRIMNKPIDSLLTDEKYTFPYMLCWANETWSRRWLGEEKEVLIRQEYSYEDDLLHIEWLMKSPFSDPRYIRIDGRPVLVVYRPGDLPENGRFVGLIKSEASKYGIPEPYVVGTNINNHHIGLYDNILNFEPQLSALPGAFNDGFSLKRLFRNIKSGIFSGVIKVYDYSFVKKLMADRKFNYKYWPCIFVGWDNTPRRGKRGIVFLNQNVSSFKESLVVAKDIAQQQKTSEQFVFINAWNEWAEGNFLEPSEEFEVEYLDAIKEVFDA